MGRVGVRQQPTALNTEETEALLQLRKACPFARDVHDVLRCAGIALDHRNAHCANLGCQTHAAIGEPLHTGYQARIHVDAPAFQRTLALAHDPVFLPAGVVVINADAAVWQRER